MRGLAGTSGVLGDDIVESIHNLERDQGRNHFRGYNIRTDFEGTESQIHNTRCGSSFREPAGSEAPVLQQQLRFWEGERT